MTGLLYTIAVIALILLAVPGAIIAEHYMYRLSRYRTLRQLAKLTAEIEGVRRWAGETHSVRFVGRTPVIKRVEAALATLDARTQSLEKDNDLRLGPHTRREWRFLRADINAVLPRSRVAHICLGLRGKGAVVWPFAEDHSAVYSDENYANGRSPSRLTTTRRRRMRGQGAYDEDVFGVTQDDCHETIGAVGTLSGVSSRPTAGKGSHAPQTSRTAGNKVITIPSVMERV